jgi:GLPGLI family protein
MFMYCFFTDDITISGGPCSINGLPGMILGLTIPRLYTSYVATKVDVSVMMLLPKTNHSKKHMI